MSCLVGAGCESSSNKTKERLYLGTGEFSPTDSWDAVLRFEDSAALNDTPADPSGTAPIKQMKDASGLALNFGHGLFVDESRDELYIGSLFTSETAVDCTNFQVACGSVGVAAKASSLNGATTLTRHLYGSNTGINKPHGVWLETATNALYVANTFGGNILVWDKGNEATGNLAPTRTITAPNLGNPVFVFIDSANDRMFVASMASAAFPKGASIQIFNNASKLNGAATPAIRIFGDTSRLSLGNNQTTHNVWYDNSKQLMFVAHHINEILIFDMKGVDWTANGTSDLTTLAPRVLRINDKSDNSDQYEWSGYGLFYLASQDRLYVSAGNTKGGNEKSSGPPGKNLTTHAIKVYDNVSASSVQDVFPPTRIIHWSNIATYYPPQPLWVTAY